MRRATSRERARRDFPGVFAFDEQNLGHTTRTRLWNVEDLDAPVLAHTYEAATFTVEDVSGAVLTCDSGANEGPAELTVSNPN